MAQLLDRVLSVPARQMMKWPKHLEQVTGCITELCQAPG